MNALTTWIGDHAAQLIGSGVVVLLVYAASRALSIVGGRFVSRRIADEAGPAAVEREQRLRTLWGLLRRVAVISFVIVAILLILAVWNIPLTPFLAVGSVIAVALGFGAQDVVKDVIAGFLIVAENQYSVGDVVTLAEASGTVEEIRLRVTVLRDLQGRVHYVPNGTIRVATNLTQEFAQVVVSVGVAYKESVDQVIDVLREELGMMAEDAKWGPVILEPPEILGVDDLADSAVRIKVAMRVLPDDQWPLRREFLRRVKNRFDAEGIEIPFPQVKVWSADT